MPTNSTVPSRIKYGVEDPRLEKALERWDEVQECEYEKKLRERGISNLDYFTGEDQGWDDDGARAELEAEGRPALTLNRISPIVRLIQGSRPKTEAAYYATEESDVQTADIMNACKDHVESRNKWEFTEDMAFLHMMIMERLVIDIMPTYKEDPQGEIELKLGNPFNYYPDPQSKEMDRSDMRYCFEEWDLEPSEAKLLWPDKAEEIDAITGGAEGGGSATAKGRKAAVADQYDDPKTTFYDAGSNKIKVVLYWYREPRVNSKIVDLASIESEEGPQVYDSDVSVDELEEKLEEMGGAERFMVQRQDYEVVKYMIFSADQILEEGENPWVREDGQPTNLSERIPVLIVEPCRVMAGAKDELIGILKDYKDPQRFHNKLASAIIQIIGTSAHSGFAYEANAMSPEMKRKLKKQGSKPGFHLELNAGGMNKFKPLVEGAPPQGHVMMAREMGTELLDISGVESLVNTGSLGKDASGKAIGLKMNQGSNVISWLFNSFRYGQHCLSEMIRDAIQRLFTYEKVIRIKGPRMKYITINEQIMDPMTGAMQILNDVTIGKFDSIVTDRDSLPTMKIERFKYFSEMVKSGALILPPPVLSAITMELMDDPDLKRIVEEEMGQWQMQQQQMMMAGGGMPGQAQPPAAGQAGGMQ